MCHKQTVISPLPVKLAKITVIVIFFCFAECAAGSCLSYGHACWGAHGKRNGGHNTVPSKDSFSTNKASQWFLSKLVRSPFDLRYVSERNLDLPTNHQFFPDPQIEDESLKSQEDARNFQGIYSNEEVLFDDLYSNQRPRFNKMKIPKLLEE